MNFARDHAPRLYLDPTLGKYYAIKFARDDHMISFDLTFHASAFAQDQAVAGQQVSLHLSVNPKYARGFEGSLTANAFIEEAREFAAFRIFTLAFG